MLFSFHSSSLCHITHMAKNSHKLLPLLSLCILVLLASPAWPTSRQRSDLSQWLAKQPTPALKQLLAGHPRFADQHIVVKRGNDNELTDAVATVLQTNLRKIAWVVSDAPAEAPTLSGQSLSVDDLVCHPSAADYQLRVSAEPSGQRNANVTVELIDNYGSGLVDEWHWRGRLSSAEREYMDEERALSGGTGQLNAPWQESQVAEAATALSREFVCGLRPWINGQTKLSWTGDSAQLNTALADTLRTSQHYIAAYNELALSPDEGEYVIETRAVPMSGGVWQLWITGRPQLAGLPTVEAATYLRGPIPPPQVAVASPRPATRGADHNSAPRDAMRIDMLGISRQVHKRGADLVLRLRLSNVAQRKLEYGLRTSGGVFAGCRGNSANYRHGAWGTSKGSLDAGESRVTTLRIENVAHQPGLLRGQSACAGFADLAAFSNYASQGDRVTQYLRWND